MITDKREPDSYIAVLVEANNPDDPPKWKYVTIDELTDQQIWDLAMRGDDRAQDEIARRIVSRDGEGEPE